VIEVRIKPDGDFQNLYSASVFTIRWPVSSTLHIDSISQPGPAAAHHPIAAQGEVTTDIHHRYQKFAGFGLTTLAASGIAWQKDSQYVILNLHVSGTPRVGYYELINDAWTLEQNSDLYQELGGYDQTGTIYHPIATLSADLDLFLATAVDNRHALVEWNTLGEYNTSHFDILRSTDLETWSLVETLPAANFSITGTSYGVMDQDVHPDDHSELTVWYALRQVDLNGQSKTYDPQPVTFNRDPLWNPCSFYPNPAQDFIHIEAPLEWGALQYELTTELGQQVIRGDLNAGGNQVDIRALPACTVMVRVYDRSGHPVMAEPLIHFVRD
jgi:hypothetical protein